MSKTRRQHRGTGKRRTLSKTRRTGIRGRGTYIKGWSRQQPNRHQRTVMMKKCGKKCFLGTKKSFPICTKNTCRINKKGLHAAYSRAKEYMTIKGTKKYKNIADKAFRMLYK